VVIAAASLVNRAKNLASGALSLIDEEVVAEAEDEGVVGGTGVLLPPSPETPPGSSDDVFVL
jgi:hypothetical protein